jgi:AraC family transcriptional regulator
MAMTYKIVSKEAFKVVGKSTRISSTNDDNSLAISRLWDEADAEGLLQTLSNLAGSRELIGVCTDYEQEKGEFTYIIAIEKPSGVLPGDFIEREIPAATWAVFESVGPLPGAIQKVWRHIFSEWFPSTEYQHANAPELEIYPAGDTNERNYKCEAWVPIIK